MESGELKILFIGNSYIYFNDLPGMLGDLFRAGGEKILMDSVTSGGKTLDWHWDNPETLDAIAQGGWDYVVLQDQSLRAIEEPDRLLGATAQFAQKIRAVGAVPVLYVTWARQHIPEMQAKITEIYLQAARAIDGIAAPVGPAWSRALDACPSVSLYQEDRSHPSILGTYLAACVFYGVFLGASPIGLIHEFDLSPGVKAVVDPEIAALLQKAAQETLHETGNGDQ